jgi:hypothetical protein
MHLQSEESARVGKKNPGGNLENITVRLDTKIREAAEKSAKGHNVPLSVEIRSALTSYYQLGNGTVTFEALEERLRKHEELFHGAKETLWPDRYTIAPQDLDITSKPEKPLASAKVETVEAIVAKPDPDKSADLARQRTADIAKVLARLIEMLEGGLHPTASDLEEATGISSRQIGRLLNARGIEAKNTRIAKRAERYFLPAMLPQVREVYKRLNQ